MGSSAGMLRNLCSKIVRLVHGDIILIKYAIGALIAFDAPQVLVPGKSRVRSLCFHIAVPELRYWGFGTLGYFKVSSKPASWHWNIECHPSHNSTVIDFLSRLGMTEW